MTTQTSTPTDPIRDEAVKVLAEALHAAEFDCWPEPGECRADAHAVDAGRTLDASPTLARRLAFGTAWDAAVAALPEDGSLIVGRYQWHGREPEYEAAFESQRYRCGESAIHTAADADTPELALAALAAKLGSGK